MTRLALFALVLLIFSGVGLSQSHAEIPLENPEVLEPPARGQGISPSPGENVAPSPNEVDGADAAMTLERLGEIAQALDGEARIHGNGILLTLADVRVTIIADPGNNRMRAFAAFKTLDGVDGQQLYRMMQANFDAALDARYAIAKGHLISVFIHPLAELSKDQFIEGLGQVVNLVKTFGTAYTSGAMTFGGGDSRNLHRELIDDLLKKGEEI